MLDDWVVVSIENENQVSQKCIREIRELVQNGSTHLDSLIMSDSNLFEKINTIDFQPGPPLYLRQSVLPNMIRDRRFKI